MENLIRERFYAVFLDCILNIFVTIAVKMFIYPCLYASCIDLPIYTIPFTVLVIL